MSDGSNFYASNAIIIGLSDPRSKGPSVYRTLSLSDPRSYRAGNQMIRYLFMLQYISIGLLSFQRHSRAHFRTFMLLAPETWLALVSDCSKSTILDSTLTIWGGGVFHKEMFNHKRVSHSMIFTTYDWTTFHCETPSCSLLYPFHAEPGFRSASEAL